MGYTFGMKTAISLPDDLFRRAERLARRLKKSRSKLYSEAIAEYVTRRDPDRVTAKLDALYEAEVEADRFVTAAARRILELSDW